LRTSAGGLWNCLQIGSWPGTKVNVALPCLAFHQNIGCWELPYCLIPKHLFSVLEGENRKELLEAGSEYLLRGFDFYDAVVEDFYTLTFIKDPKLDQRVKRLGLMNDQMPLIMVNDPSGAPLRKAYRELYIALQQRWWIWCAKTIIPSFSNLNITKFVNSIL